MVQKVGQFSEGSGRDNKVVIGVPLRAALKLRGVQYFYGCKCIYSKGGFQRALADFQWDVLCEISYLALSIRFVLGPLDGPTTPRGMYGNGMAPTQTRQRTRWNHTNDSERMAQHDITVTICWYAMSRSYPRVLFIVGIKTSGIRAPLPSSHSYYSAMLVAVPPTVHIEPQNMGCVSKPREHWEG